MRGFSLPELPEYQSFLDPDFRRGRRVERWEGLSPSVLSGEGRNPGNVRLLNHRQLILESIAMDPGLRRGDGLKGKYSPLTP